MNNMNRQHQTQTEENVKGFKDDLFKQYKDTGIVDNLQAQLRYKIVNKLQKSATLQKQQENNLPEDQRLKKRMMASLIVDYFNHEDFSYSKNVFLPECGFQNSTLEKAEMLNIMQATDIFTEYKESLLSNILDIMMGPETDKKKRRVYKVSSQTQTEHGDSIMNLETRLNDIDNLWKRKIQDEMIPNAATIEERMERFKRDYEKRMKADAEAELTRVRNFEIANVRLEESQKCQQEMQEYREELDKRYQEKLNKLRDREKQTLDRCNQKMKDLESYNHDHRQKIMKDFELLKLREEGVEKQQQLNQEKLAIEQSKLETLQKQLREKIRKLDEEKFYQEKHQENEKSMAKLEVYKQVQSEQLDYIEKKKTLDTEIFKIENFKEQINTLKSQNLALTEQNKEYVDRIEEITRKNKDNEYNTKETRDTLQQITQSYQREQDNSKNLQEQIRLKQDEINLLKQTLETKDELLVQQKHSQIDQMKKMNNEIHSYQEKIEKLENQLKTLRQQNQENEDLIAKGVGQPISYIAQRNPKIDDTMTISKLQNVSYLQQNSTLEQELARNREERQKVLKELMSENDVLDKRGYNAKFENVWDLSSSNVELSQMPSIAKKELDRRQQQNDIIQESQIQQNQSRKVQKNNFINNQTNYQSNEGGILDKVDFAQSVSYDQQQTQGFNKIEQNYKQQKQQQQLQQQQQKQLTIPEQQSPSFNKNITPTYQQEQKKDSPKQTRGKKIFQDVYQYRNDDDDDRYEDYNKLSTKEPQTLNQQKTKETDNNQKNKNNLYISPQQKQQKNEYDYGVDLEEEDDDTFLNKKQDKFTKPQESKKQETEYKPSSYQSSQFPPLQKKSELPSINQQRHQLYEPQEMQESDKFQSEEVEDMQSSHKKQSEGVEYEEELFEEIDEDIEDF